jgi:hypothetical protein
MQPYNVSILPAHWREQSLNSYSHVCWPVVLNLQFMPQFDMACYGQSCQLASNWKRKHQRAVHHVPFGFNLIKTSQNPDILWEWRGGRSTNRNNAGFKFSSLLPNSLIGCILTMVFENNCVYCQERDGRQNIASVTAWKFCCWTFPI